MRMRVFLIIAISLAAFAAVAVVSNYVPSHVFTVPEHDTAGACSISSFTLSHTTSDTTDYAYTVFVLTASTGTRCTTAGWPTLNAASATLSSIQVPLSGFSSAPGLSFRHATVKKPIEVTGHSSITFALRTKRTCKARHAIDLSLPGYPTTIAQAPKFCPADIIESPLAAT